jgi:hypothetical protein
MIGQLMTMQQLMEGELAGKTFSVALCPPHDLTQDQTWAAASEKLFPDSVHYILGGSNTGQCHCYENFNSRDD